MDHRAALHVWTSLPDRHPQALAARRPRPWRAAMAGCVLLVRLDLSRARVALSAALARRAALRRAYGRARVADGHRCPTARGRTADRRVFVGAAAELAHAARRRRPPSRRRRAVVDPGQPTSRHLG